MTDTAVSVRLSDLVVRRGSHALVRIPSLAARSGEFLAVIGPNGAGKSTVLKALTGEWAASGELIVLGRRLHDWRRVELARRMAIMPQHSHLAFDFRVREVVALGRLPHRGEPPQVTRRVLDAVIEALALERFADRRFTTLSGGERQRVQFARVLAQIWDQRPERLLLLDEPTSALDLAQQQVVLDHAWRASREGATVIAVMHDLNMVSRFADRVVVLKQGELVADAPPAQFLNGRDIGRVFDVAVETETSTLDRLPVVLMRPPHARSG